MVLLLLPVELCYPILDWGATCIFLSDAPVQSGLFVPQSCILLLHRKYAPDWKNKKSNRKVKEEQPEVYNVQN